jgi:hypothetical protein
MSGEKLLYIDGCPAGNTVDFDPKMIREKSTILEYPCQDAGEKVGVEVKPGGAMVISVKCLRKPCPLAKAR